VPDSKAYAQFAMLDDARNETLSFLTVSQKQFSTAAFVAGE
jgi:hypothetical protein